jgi:hypothetical protein
METQRQYDRRRRQKQLVHAMCAASPSQNNLVSHRSRRTKTLSPGSGYFRDADEVLEIYDGYNRPSIHKRRRPRDTVGLYGQFDPNLGSSSKSSNTDSDTPSRNYSDIVFSYEDATASLPRSESIEELNLSPVQMPGMGTSPVPFERSTTRTAVSLHRPMNKRINERKRTNPLKTAISLNGNVTEAGEPFLCCNVLSFLKKKRIKFYGPGMSLTEEKTLWRSTLEGNIWANHHATNVAAGDNIDIDQIEVVPVDHTFQTSGSDNYAEMDNVGMVFVHAATDQKQSSPPNATVPWWKRDSWKMFSDQDAARSDNQDVSHAKTTAHTEKISNRQSSHPSRKGKYSDKVAETICVIHEETAPMEEANHKANNVTDESRSSVHCLSETETRHFKNNSNLHRPFQVFNPKFESATRSKVNKESELSDEEISAVAIPHLLDSTQVSSCRVNAGAPMPRMHNSNPVIVETIELEESESELGSETDISELIRKRDDPKNENEECVRLLSDIVTESSGHDSLDVEKDDAVFNLLADKRHSVEHSEEIGMVHQHVDEGDLMNGFDQMRKTTRRRTKDKFFSYNRSLNSPISTRSRKLENKAEETAERTSDGKYVDSAHATKLLSNHSVQCRNAVDPANLRLSARNHHNCRNQSERGRCDDLIDLTDHSERHTSPRKRSKSPIRLYGDPPFPFRMDGSPVHSPRIFSRPKDDCDGLIIQDSDSQEQLSDNDLTILQEIIARREDIADLIAVTNPTKHTLKDGSRIVMLKPVVNVYKIQSDDRQYNVGYEKQIQTSPQNRSRKPSLQVRTVFSDQENDYAANYGGANSERFASPIVEVSSPTVKLSSPTVKVSSPPYKMSSPSNKMSSPTVKVSSPTYKVSSPTRKVSSPTHKVSSPIFEMSIDVEEISLDDELQKLALSERLLRKELQEVQQKTAKRRWEIEIEDTAHDKLFHCPSVIDVVDRQDAEAFESPTRRSVIAPSLIDVSCIDVEFDANHSLVSSLPVASAYQETNKNKNKSPRNSTITNSWYFMGNERDGLNPKENVGEIDLRYERASSGKANHQFVANVPLQIPSTINRTTSHDAMENFAELRSETDEASLIAPPISRSRQHQQVWSSPAQDRDPQPSHFREVDLDLSPDWINSNDSDGLYVPSLSSKGNKHPFVDANHSMRELSKSMPFKRCFSSEDELKMDADVLIDKDLSWGAIEMLYQLSARSMSESSDDPVCTSHEDSSHNDRSGKQIQRKISEEIPTLTDSSEIASASEDVHPFCTEGTDVLNQSDAHFDMRKTTGSAVFEDNTTDRSLYAKILRWSPINTPQKDKVLGSPKVVRDPDSRRRLQSLLHRHKHLVIGDDGDNVEIVADSNKELESENCKGQGIYAELVRRSRLSSRVRVSNDNKLSISVHDTEHPIDIQNTAKLGGERFTWQASPSKRLERLRKLHMEMQARRQAEQESEKESHFSKRLSPARRRASKSLRRKFPNEDTSQFSTKGMIPLTSVAQQPGGENRSSAEPLVQVYMPVSGDMESDRRKMKRDADHTNKDLMSIASSTRSKDLVQSLPSAAKTRNVASGKPGR